MCLFRTKVEQPKGPPPIKPLKDTNRDLPGGKATRDQDDTAGIEYGSSTKKGSQAQAQGAEALRIPVNMPGQADKGGINDPGGS
jgi:hypothetical protein